MSVIKPENTSLVPGKSNFDEIFSKNFNKYRFLREFSYLARFEFSDLEIKLIDSIEGGVVLGKISITISSLIFFYFFSKKTMFKSRFFNFLSAVGMSTLTSYYVYKNRIKIENWFIDIQYTKELDDTFTRFSTKDKLNLMNEKIHQRNLYFESLKKDKINLKI